MLSDRELAAVYLPHERDPELEPLEYYYLQPTMRGERVIKVEVREVLPTKDGTEYGIYQSGRRIDVGYGDGLRGVRMAALYDNKRDCKNQTHLMFDGWEALRDRLNKKHRRQDDADD